MGDKLLNNQMEKYNFEGEDYFLIKYINGLCFWNNLKWNDNTESYDEGVEVIIADISKNIIGTINRDGYIYIDWQ